MSVGVRAVRIEGTLEKGGEKMFTAISQSKIPSLGTFLVI
jgi:hypothetical protein